MIARWPRGYRFTAPDAVLMTLADLKACISPIGHSRDVPNEALRCFLKDAQVPWIKPEGCTEAYYGVAAILTAIEPPQPEA